MPISAPQTITDVRALLNAGAINRSLYSEFGGRHVDLMLPRLHSTELRVISVFVAIACWEWP